MPRCASSVSCAPSDKLLIHVQIADHAPANSRAPRPRVRAEGQRLLEGVVLHPAAQLGVRSSPRSTQASYQSTCASCAPNCNFVARRSPAQQQPHLAFALAHVVAHRQLGDRGVGKFLQNPGTDAPRRAALLARRTTVFVKHLVNQSFVRPTSAWPG